MNSRRAHLLCLNGRIVQEIRRLWDENDFYHAKAVFGGKEIAALGVGWSVNRRYSVFHYFSLCGSMPNRSQRTCKTVLVQMYTGDDAVEPRGQNHLNVMPTQRMV